MVPGIRRGPRREREKLYAVYRGDVFLDLGTKSELCERLGISRSYLNWALSPTAHERAGDNADALIVIQIEEDDPWM